MDQLDTQVPSEVEGQTEQVDESIPSAFEVVLLVPAQKFLDLPRSTEANGEGYLELPLPSQLSDAVHDLRAIITESPEGFWLGSFGLRPIVSEEIKSGDQPADGKQQERKWGPWVDMTPPAVDPLAGPVDPKMWRLTNEGVLGDYADLSAVFGGSFEGKRRGLKVIPTSYSALAMNQHLLRVRDTLSASLSTLPSSGTYDPTSLAIGAGSTVYATVRGEPSEEALAAQAAKEEEEAQSASKSKKSAGKASKKEESSPAAAPSTPAKEPFIDFKLDDLSPNALLDLLKPSASASITSPCLRSLGISPWSPPPHTRRLRGDLVYLTVTTLEGESYHITGSTTGFWISKTTANSFDPSPRAVLPNKMRSGAFQGFFELLSALSPSFAKGLATLIQSQHSAQSGADIFASLPITHATPAAPWLVAAPQHSADPFRTQLAYLLTGSTTAETLPAARDWNDEYAQYKELPQSSVHERLMRERLQSRVQADFTSAAVRGAMSIARGDIPPLNPNEAQEAHTWVHNNMLFTRAEDAIGAYSHVGGNEASKYAASKDLAGVNLLERIDVDGLHSMATVLVDYAGERWVAQSLIPGLFKTKEPEEEPTETPVLPADDEEAKKAAQEAADADKPFPSAETANKDDYPPTGPFRIVYGSSNPELPDESVRASQYFHQLAKKVADTMRFAEHKVIDAKGKETMLYMSTDMHGVAAPDGRSYFIDCSRLHCVDVEFLEKDIEGPIVSDSAESQANGVHTPSAYPHRLVLLRPELLEAYHSSQLKLWLEERVAETRSRVEKEDADKPKPDSVESELKEAAIDAVAAPKAETEIPTSVINAEDFVLRFNPDAFVERKAVKEGETPVTIYDPEEESSKNVRLASAYLRDTVLASFVTDVAGSGTIFTDGYFLSKIMHRKGINMRYLGLLAEKIDSEGPKIEISPNSSTLKEDVDASLKILKETVQFEMVIRASKHILNRLLRSADLYDHPYIISHFFNCLLGASFQPNPVAEVAELATGVSANRSWTSLTPAGLRKEITSQVESRFRYALPQSMLTEKLVPRKLLREISMRVGIQLAARDYKFTGTGDAAVTSTPSTEEKKEPSSKKKKGKTAKEASAKPIEGPPCTFRPEDVLNIMPVVKSSIQKSAMADESFNAGQRSFAEGHIDLGSEQIQDALQFCEQIYGGVHPEASSKYHNLGIIYHQLSQTLIRQIQMHEVAENALKEAAPEAKEKLQALLVDDIDAVRSQVDTYLHQAVRMVRQSVVIAERTLGLDAPDTIQQYADLGLLEQAVGNTAAGMRFTKHAMLLWTSVYGPRHPNIHSLLTNASGMVQTEHGLTAAVPLLKELANLSESIWGRDSINLAQIQHALAQAYAQSGDLASSLPFMEEALRIFTAVLPEDAKEIAEAKMFVQFVGDKVTKDGAQRQALEDRLKQSKGPKIPGSSKSALRSKATIGAFPIASGSGTKLNAPEVAAAPAVKEHGQKANLSVDELVNFIQGKPSPSKPSKASGGSRKRKVTPPSAAA